MLKVSLDFSYKTVSYQTNKIRIAIYINVHSCFGKWKWFSKVVKNLKVLIFQVICLLYFTAIQSRINPDKHNGPTVDLSKSKLKNFKRVEITFDNPDKYKGPIVEGWPPNHDRYMPNYIHPNENSFSMQPSKVM